MTGTGPNGHLHVTVSMLVCANGVDLVCMFCEIPIDTYTLLVQDIQLGTATNAAHIV